MAELLKMQWLLYVPSAVTSEVNCILHTHTVYFGDSYMLVSIAIATLNRMKFLTPGSYQNNVKNRSSYFTENILCLHDKDRPVNTV
jgi:hypothetical protein